MKHHSWASAGGATSNRNCIARPRTEQASQRKTREDQTFTISEWVSTGALFSWTTWIATAPRGSVSTGRMGSSRLKNDDWNDYTDNCRNHTSTKTKNKHQQHYQVIATINNNSNTRPGLEYAEEVASGRGQSLALH